MQRRISIRHHCFRNRRNGLAPGRAYPAIEERNTQITTPGPHRPRTGALELEPSEAWSPREIISKREGTVFLTLLLVTLVAGQVLLLVHPALGLAALGAYQA